MDLKTVVKVGNVSNLSDARYCAGFGVDMIGFNVDSEDDEHISAETAKEIMGWIAGTSFILEYGNMSIHAIENIKDQLSIDNCQVEDINVANSLAQQGCLVYFKYVIHDLDDVNELPLTLDNLSSNIQYVVIECSSSELSAMINDALSTLNSSIKIMKSYAIDKSTVLDDIASNKFHGIALKGSQEEKPGFKDYDELADILEVLEID